VCVCGTAQLSPSSAGTCNASAPGWACVARRRGASGSKLRMGVSVVKGRLCLGARRHELLVCGLACGGVGDGAPLG